MTMGHEERFRPPSLSGRCRLGEATLAETRGNGRDAPEAVVSVVAIVGASSTWRGAVEHCVYEVRSGQLLSELADGLRDPCADASGGAAGRCATSTRRFFRGVSPDCNIVQA